MKFKMLLLAACAAAGMANSASAQTTVINITGATAFRSAAVNSILNSYNAGVQFGFTGASFTGATQQIFVGSFPGITGTTIVRTFWSGSTEGTRDVTGDVTLNSFLPTNSTVAVSPGQSGLATGTAAGIAQMNFSDCTQSSTIYSSPTLIGGPVGTIVFSMIKNEMALTNPKIASYNAFTNVTSQQFRSLFQVGSAFLSQFTGNDADDGTFVLATGRNDFSGTRTIYLAETGYGISNLVQQWKMTSNGSNEITQVQIWPVGDVAGTTDNRSLQWTLGVDTAGNGGYFSGGALRDQLDDISENVTAKNAAGDTIGTGLNVILVTSISIADAATAITNGAKALNYNGVGITPAAPLSAGDKAKIQNGTYTLWSFENFFRDPDCTASEITFFNAVTGAIGANIGTAGLTLTEMTGVTRATDGGTVIIASE